MGKVTLDYGTGHGPRHRWAIVIALAVLVAVGARVWKLRTPGTRIVLRGNLSNGHDVWTFDELRDTSDLVVIGTASASVRTGKTWNAPAGGGIHAECIVIISVETVLKGTPGGPTIPVVHYRYTGGAESPGSPGQVYFANYSATGSAGPFYLLFLKRRPDGKYEPVSGRLQPQASVQVLISAEQSLGSLDQEDWPARKK